MSYLAEFMTIAGIHLLAVMSPGPDTAIVLSHTVRYGQRVGRLTAIGVGCGIGVHVLYSVLGIGFLLQQYSWLQPLLMLLAALYLGYLGLYGFFNRGTEVDADFNEAEPARVQTTWSPFLSGFLTNGLNPKATLFFIALFTSVVAESTPLAVRMGYGLYLMLATGFWFALFAHIVGHPKLQQQLKTHVPQVGVLMSLLLCLLSVQLLWTLLTDLSLFSL